jgi:hypothetical protein
MNGKLNQQNITLGVVAFHSRWRAPVHTRPMLTLNCPLSSKPLASPSFCPHSSPCPIALPTQHTVCYNEKTKSTLRNWVFSLEQNSPNAQSLNQRTCHVHMYMKCKLSSFSCCNLEVGASPGKPCSLPSACNRQPLDTLYPNDLPFLISQLKQTNVEGAALGAFRIWHRLKWGLQSKSHSREGLKFPCCFIRSIIISLNIKGTLQFLYKNINTYISDTAVSHYNIKISSFKNSAENRLDKEDSPLWLCWFLGIKQVEKSRSN